MDYDVVHTKTDNPLGALGQGIGRTDPDYKPIAGLGFGLPSARLYARHFGGDLELKSLNGFGCDLYVRLDRTGGKYEAS